MRPSTATFLASTLLSGACATTPSAPEPLGYVTNTSTETVPYDPSVLSQGEQSSISLFLTEVDASVRAWNNLTLTANSEDDRRKALLLEENLSYRTSRRRAELINELESGAPLNRMVAAVALGFSEPGLSHTEPSEALSPLLATIDDPSEEIASNALLGLSILARPETPLRGILGRLQFGKLERTRINAILALRKITAAGASPDEAIPYARAALNDPDPVVRAQSALLLASALDTASIDRLKLLIHDEVPIVGHAAARAIAYIGSRDPHQKGVAARILAGTLQKVEPGLRASILHSLTGLAGRNHGDEAADWVEWAHTLP